MLPPHVQGDMGGGCWRMLKCERKVCNAHDPYAVFVNGTGTTDILLDTSRRMYEECVYSFCVEEER